MSKRYPPEQRARAVKMVLDHLDEYRSVYAACQAIGPKVGWVSSRCVSGRFGVDLGMPSAAVLPVW
jgi:hypothetical protein